MTEVSVELREAPFRVGRVTGGLDVPGVLRVRGHTPVSVAPRNSRPTPATLKGLDPGADEKGDSRQSVEGPGSWVYLVPSLWFSPVRLLVCPSVQPVHGPDTRVGPDRQKWLVRGQIVGGGTIGGCHRSWILQDLIRRPPEGSQSGNPVRRTGVSCVRTSDRRVGGVLGTPVTPRLTRRGVDQGRR